MVNYNCSPGLFRLQNQPSVRVRGDLINVPKKQPWKCHNGPFCEISVRMRLGLLLILSTLSVDAAFVPSLPQLIPAEAPLQSRLTLILANETDTSVPLLMVSSCYDLAENSVFGLGIGSVSEEYVRAPDGLCCVAHSTCCRMPPCAVRLGGVLRFAHEHGERVDVMPDSLQVPAGAVFTQPPNPDAHAVRAVQVANRAHDWIALYTRVVSSGPDKWPLRHLLLALAITLVGSLFCAVLIQICSLSIMRMRKRAR